MVRDLYNVREVAPAEDRAAVTPLASEEERRFRAAAISQIAEDIAEKGWARFPAHSTPERIRMYEIAQRLSEHLGQPVKAEPENIVSMFFSLDPADAADPATPATQGHQRA